MNRSSIAFASVFVLVLGLFFAVPTFRDAVKMGPVSVRFALGKPDLSEAELRRMAQKAQQRGDASTLAFVAMRLDDSREAMQLGKRAIALNPSLSWIEYFIIKHDWSDLRRAGFGPETQEVVAADPGNALGYLLRAEWVRRADGSKLAPSGAFNQPARRAEWETMMQKAFSAPLLDDYLSRKLRLDREVCLAHGLAPFTAAWSTTAAPLPDLVGIWQYGDQLIQSGDLTSIGRAVGFGAMLQGGQTGIERLAGQNIRMRGLSALGKKLDLPLSDPVSASSPSLKEQFLEFATVAAFVVQLSLLLTGLAAAMVVLSTAALLLLRRGSGVWQRLLRVSATVGVLASTVALVSYLPFASSYSAYLRATTAFDAAAGARPFLAFWMVIRSGQAYLSFWWLVIIMAGLGLLWRAAVHTRRALASPA